MSLALRSRCGPLVVILAFGLALSSCGGSKTSTNQVASLADSGSTGTSTPAADAATSEQKLMDFAQCMRDNGLPDFQDPKVDAQGNIDRASFRGGDGSSGVDPQSQTFRDAMTACRSKLDGTNLGSGGGKFDRTKTQDAMLAYTACLRAQGLDNVQDVPQGGPGQGGQGGATSQNSTGSPGGGGTDAGPPRDGGGPGGSGNGPLRRLGLDPADPKVKAANDVCQPALQQAMQDARGTQSTNSAGQ